MVLALRDYRWIWLVVGLLGGLLLAGFWPDAPLHAVATDSVDTFAVATGALDADIEAVIMLDFITGQMKGRALGVQSYKFQAYYEANVIMGLTSAITDLNARIKTANRLRERKNLPAIEELQAPEKPRFLLVTGGANLRRGGGTRGRPGMSVIYVVETTTGIVLAYGMTWAPEIVNQGRIHVDVFRLLAGECFRLDAPE